MFSVSSETRETNYFPPAASLLHMLIRKVGEGQIPKDDANV